MTFLRHCQVYYQNSIKKLDLKIKRICKSINRGAVLSEGKMINEYIFKKRKQATYWKLIQFLEQEKKNLFIRKQKMIQINSNVYIDMLWR